MLGVGRGKKRDETDVGEWFYEVREAGIRLEHDREGTLYIYTAFLARLGGVGEESESRQGIYRFWRSRELGDWKYKLGDVFITKLIGPVAKEVVLDEESRAVVIDEKVTDSEKA